MKFRLSGFCLMCVLFGAANVLAGLNEGQNGGNAAANTPEMVAIGPGEFTMGSSEAGPSHRVQIAYSFEVSKYPITVSQFARFVSETGYDAGSQCYTHVSGLHDTQTHHSWRDPGFSQGETQPVVCVSLNDAQAYVAWLAKRTGRTYRLLSESEYEYVNRGGTTTSYWWGGAVGSGHANCDGCGSAWDGKQTSPVGSFAPNAFGLYDTTGNVWSWTSDCWSPDYAGAPTDGSAAMKGDCHLRAIRGGSWGHDPKVALSRHGIAVDVQDHHTGFRLARTL